MTNPNQSTFTQKEPLNVHIVAGNWLDPLTYSPGMPVDAQDDFQWFKVHPGETRRQRLITPHEVNRLGHREGTEVVVEQGAMGRVYWLFLLEADQPLPSKCDFVF